MCVRACLFSVHERNYMELGSLIEQYLLTVQTFKCCFTDLNSCLTLCDRNVYWSYPNTHSIVHAAPLNGGSSCPRQNVKSGHWKREKILVTPSSEHFNYFVIQQSPFNNKSRILISFPLNLVVRKCSITFLKNLYDTHNWFTFKIDTISTVKIYIYYEQPAACLVEVYDCSLFNRE